VKAAVESPLLETSVKGAKAILLHVRGGYDLSMQETNEAAAQIQQVADKDAIIIFGVSVSEELSNEIIITIIATGFEERPEMSGAYSAIGSKIDRGYGLGSAPAAPKSSIFDMPPVQAAEPEPPQADPIIAEPEVEEEKDPFEKQIRDTGIFDIPGFLKK
jgi:cell division GTPase FtsZ